MGGGKWKEALQVSKGTPALLGFQAPTSLWPALDWGAADRGSGGRGGREWDGAQKGKTG